MQEPNINKRIEAASCGFPNLLGMTFLNTHAVACGAERQEFVSKTEAQGQSRGRLRFLRAPRARKHTKSSARWTFYGTNLQPAVRARAGYGDRSPRQKKKKKALEENHARTLHAHAEHFSHHAHAGDSAGASRYRATDGVRAEIFADDASLNQGTASSSSTGNPRRSGDHFPNLAATAHACFSHAQQRPFAMHDMAQLAATSLNLVDREL